MIRKTISVIFFAILISGYSVSAQRDWSAMKVETMELAPDIYRLFVGNSVAVVAFSGPDGLLVVDAAYEQTSPQLLESLGLISDKPIRFLVNTHLHADHTGGNLALGKDAMIIAHHSVKDWLASDRRRGDDAPGPFPVNAQPALTFEGDMHLYFNEADVYLHHMPAGHTRGDIILYFDQAKVLVVGDLLFAGYFPFVDVSQGGNPMGLINNLHWILQTYPEDLTVVGGHGPAMSMQQLRDYLTQLEASVAAIATAKASGQGIDELKANRILAEWESFGTFFITEDRWIDIVYPFVE
jgi:cyclase